MLSVGIFDWIAGDMLEWRQIARKLFWMALPVALISGVGWFCIVAIEMSGLPPAQALAPAVLRLVWSQTHFGEVCKWRSMFWFLCAVMSPVVFSSIRRAMIWPSNAANILLTASLAWAGHGETGLAPRVHVWADVVHLLICAIWPIGLLPFGCLLLALRRARSPESNAAMSKLVYRFSSLSLFSVAVLAASGVVNGFCLLGSLHNLVFTTYGRFTD